MGSNFSSGSQRFGGNEGKPYLLRCTNLRMIGLLKVSANGDEWRSFATKRDRWDEFDVCGDRVPPR